MEAEAGGHSKNAQRPRAHEKPRRATIADLRKVRSAPAPELKLSQIQ
jgi:hypothetical protein